MVVELRKVRAVAAESPWARCAMLHAECGEPGGAEEAGGQARMQASGEKGRVVAAMCEQSCAAEACEGHC